MKAWQAGARERQGLHGNQIWGRVWGTTPIAGFVQGLMKRVTGRSGADDANLRRVALQLAGMTVGLLLVMLLVLGVIVYTITGQQYQKTLEDTLTVRANQFDPTVCQKLPIPCPPQFRQPFGGLGRPQGGPGGGSQPHAGQSGGSQPLGQPGGGFPGQGRGGSSGLSQLNADVAVSDASVVYVDTRLSIIDAHGNLGSQILSKQDAKQAISMNTVVCCSTHSYQGQDYLVYTKPLVGPHGRVVGATQTSISKHQFEQNENTLLAILAIAGAVGLLISGGISGLLVRRALQPIRLAIQRQRDFVADAAHELRTPLAIQRTVGEVGMADPAIDDLQSTVAQMLGENQHLTRLVEDLSLLARADTGAVSIDRRPVDLSSLVRDTAAELEPLAEAQGVALHSDVRGAAQTVGDILRLRQLLLILLDNALKHTPPEGVVQVRLFAQGDRARLQVIDSGPGIDPDDLPHIFNRFYRADRARTGEGSGLGLAIGTWIVEAHGGQIQAGNVSPHGAVFTVTLPLTRAAVAS